MSDEHLIGDSELDPQSGGAVEGAHPATAVARRPTDLLSKAEVERLSRRTDGIGIAYFVVHYALIAGGAWLTWWTFPGPAFWPVLHVHTL